MGWQINSTRTAHLRARKRALAVVAVRRKDVQRIKDRTCFDAMGFEVLDDLVSVPSQRDLADELCTSNRRDRPNFLLMGKAIRSDRWRAVGRSRRQPSCVPADACSMHSNCAKPIAAATFVIL